MALKTRRKLSFFLGEENLCDIGLLSAELSIVADNVVEWRV